MSDLEAFHNWLSTKERDTESLCRHCGACCGASDDPCEHLTMTPEGRSHCAVYTNRFGAHRTVGGRPLNCVPIRTKAGQTWPGDERCGYKGR